VLSRLRAIDRPLLAFTLLAILAGMVVLYSASAQQGNVSQLMVRRGMQVILGVVLMLVVAMIDFHRLRRFSLFIVLSSLAALIFALTMMAMRGTKGWIPVFGLTLQAVDIARVGMIIFMADRLAALGGESENRLRFRWPILVLAAFCGLVAVQPDFGSALAIGLIGTVPLVIAGLPKRWLITGAVCLLMISFVGYRVSDRIEKRVDLVRNFDPTSCTADNYQLRQSMIGIGAGGLTGQGAGLNRQKSFLPDHHTDFIFAIAGEEYGLLGSLVLLALLTSIPIRIITIGRRQTNQYNIILTASVAGMLMIYTVLNIAVTLAIFPLTGVPLPFVSHGGSALVMNMVALGLVLAISREGTDRVGGRSGVNSNRNGEVQVEDLFRM
jgi:cell division protein FtsW